MFRKTNSLAMSTKPPKRQAQNGNKIPRLSGPTKISNAATPNTKAEQRLIGRGESNADPNKVAKKVEGRSSEHAMFGKHEQENTKRLNSSLNNEWIPANLIKNTCFSSTGIILSKEECIANLELAMKNKKKADFYEVVKLSAHPQVQGTIINQFINQFTSRSAIYS
ncbi:unnamed protein product [Caenorhabditis sp. 36 PRJEB53466]|nr:unnamed protein product [Caenorhabditis sp. 36 PRJEB53466]